MVEIIPYTEDTEDDEDQSIWIPLTPRASVPATVSAENDATRNDIVIGYSGTTEIRNAISSCSRTYDEKKTSPEDLIFLEDVDDGDGDDNEWKNIPSQYEVKQLSPAQNINSSSIIEPSFSWGEQLISHLTSTATVPTTSSATDDAFESEENIIWSREDSLIDELNFVDDLRGRNMESSIEGEYDDVSFSSRKESPTTGRIRHPASESLHLRSQTDTEHDNQEDGVPLQQYRFHRIPTDQQWKQLDQFRNDKPSAKNRVQKKLIHDPLCSFPPCFLRHLHHEAKLEFNLAWESYLEQNGMPNFLAPLSLLVMGALLGMTLIITGLFRLVSLMVLTSMQVVVSSCWWMVAYAWPVALASICLSLVLGAFVWIRSRASTNGEPILNSFFISSIATVIPWGVAFTSSSLYEAIIIILSLRTCMSVLTPGSQLEDCLPLQEDNDEDYSCPVVIASGQPIYRGMSTLAISSVALLIAVMNALAVLIAANMFEQNKGQHSGSMEGTSNTRAAPYLSSYTELSLRVKCCLGPCHTVSVLTLASLSAFLLFFQTYNMHYLNTGRDILLSLADGVLTFGLGIAILVTTWSITVTAITAKSAARGIPCTELLRNALKKSIWEISSNAVWDRDNDGALRIAILEWFIDRWTHSVPSEKTKLSTQAGDEVDKNIISGANSNSFNSNNYANSNASNVQSHRESDSSSASNGSASEHQPIFPSLQNVIAKLDADETLIPTIERYREWVYSVPPTQNSSICVLLWKMCPATAVLMTVLWFVCCSIIARMFLRILQRFGAALQFAPVSNENYSWLFFMCTVAMIMMPLLALEYHRVLRWWENNTSHLEKMEHGVQSNDPMQMDLVMVLLRADSDDFSSRPVKYANFLVDTPSILHNIWLLLLESIALLEASIPVIRCATVASAAANLTSDTLCLVNLALEIKKRGLVGGIGIMIWDSFNYYVSVDFEGRKQDPDNATSDQLCEGQGEDPKDFGGQYTGAVVSAVQNVTKMSRNISCLLRPKTKHGSTGSGYANGDRGAENESHEIIGTQSCTSLSKIQTKYELGGDIQSDVSRNGGHEGCHYLNTNQGEENLFEEKSEFDERLVPVLIGGISLVGAAAGIALHANNQGKQDRKQK